MSELFKWDRGAKLFLHNLLGADHGDTLAGNVAAGDLIYGNATPKWARLAKGTQGQVLRMGASLPAWYSEDGWIDVGALTWTYASASSFTVSGDQTAIFQKGTYLKWTQTTVKYGAVASSSYSSPNTTVNVIVNTDYTVTNAAISSPFISYAANPQGWPGWFNYSPTLTGWSVVPPTYVYRYYPIGRKITLLIAQQANGTSNTSSAIGTLPVQAATVSGSNLTWLSTGHGTDNGVSLTTPIRVDILSGATQWVCYKTMAAGAWTNTGDKRVYFQIEYEF